MKNVVNGLCRMLVLPAVGLCGLGGLAVGRRRAFQGWGQFFALLPGVSGEYLRRGFYRWTMDQCSPTAVVSFGTVFSGPGCRLGNHVYIGAFCCLGEVTLEDDVLLASHVSIANGARQHGIDRLDIPVREQPGEWPHITIGRDSWIGDRAVVLADVGQHCVVAAGAVVTRPVPDYAIVAGVPARQIGSRQSTSPTFAQEALI